MPKLYFYFHKTTLNVVFVFPMRNTLTFKNMTFRAKKMSALCMSTVFTRVGHSLN